MLALYRAGRQADAVAAYDSVRRQLSEEMGIEPGAALQDLYLRIVRADPSLLDVAAALAGAAQVTVPAQQNGPLLAGLAPPPVPRQLPPDLRSNVAASVTMFGELSPDQWRRRAADTLRQLCQRAEETVGRSA